MAYYYQDISYILGSILLLLFLVGEMLHFRHLPKGGPLLLGLTLLLSTAGLSDLIFRSNPNPTIILFADSLNVFCFTFALAIILNYSLVYFSKNPLWSEKKAYLVLYIPALIISALHALSPMMIKGVLWGPISYQLNYNPGYWIIVAYGISFAFLSILFSLSAARKIQSPSEKNQSLLLVCVLILLTYFYNSSLILPFLFKTVNFASPLPTTFAILLLVYGYIEYNYFSLEKVEEEASQ
ncbi:MAG: hypothetical protein ABIH22_02775 [Candidatus Margulisiibacteriota bacterium]